MAKSKKRVPFYKRHKKLLWITGSILAVIIIVMTLFKVTPWPGALLIRTVFDLDSAKSKQALEKHTPQQPVTRLANEKYDSTGMLLDVYFPSNIGNTDKQLPVVIWTHGGAWISGGKDDWATYFKILAAKGFTVIAPNYTLAPEKTYPTPLKQLNEAYDFLDKNQGRFHADMNKVFLAGDSAGAQISSQMAAIVTNPFYAAEVGIEPTLKPSQLKGVILFCGIYKMFGLTQPAPELPKIIGWGDDTALWAYSGTKDYSDPIIRQMSPYYHVTSQFPPTFISGGNNDPLTNDQSKPFAKELSDKHVPVTTSFFADDHQPKLPHEYQFNLDTEDGEEAMSKVVDFIKARTQ
ncbi:MAG TPA: alpha/beta hydrolase [Candidatus Saccharimonadales bacterium]|nr:alpha/beta hydrolase [Candidatus Saccharimonadales bacterium]